MKLGQAAKRQRYLVSRGLPRLLVAESKTATGMIEQSSQRSRGEGPFIFLFDPRPQCDAHFPRWASGGKSRTAGGASALPVLR